MENEYIYVIMDVTDDPPMAIGYFDNLHHAKQTIQDHPEDEPISEFTPDGYDVKLEMWEVKKGFLTTDYSVVYSYKIKCLYNENTSEFSWLLDEVTF